MQKSGADPPPHFPPLSDRLLSGRCLPAAGETQAGYGRGSNGRVATIVIERDDSELAVSEVVMRAVIYARYSSENQREASLDDQIRLCRERATAEGWQVVEVFQDRALSGSSALRPAYQALMAAARAGAFDLVIAEALDRLSRDQEDVAALYKRLRFAGIRIVTLAEGEISELHVGLKGTMNALFIKRPGRQDASRPARPGGAGPQRWRQLLRLPSRPTAGVNDRQPVTGERGDRAGTGPHHREHLPELFATGASPKRIALDLNEEGVPGPRGGHWSASTINGNRSPRHRHPEQRAVYRPTGLEPAHLCKGPRHRPAGARVPGATLR